MRFVVTVLAISTLIITGSFLWVQLSLSPTNEVILHFDTAGQPDVTGTQQSVLRVLATGGVLVVINLFLATMLARRERIAAFCVSGGTLLLAVLLFISTWVIIANNR